MQNYYSPSLPLISSSLFPHSLSLILIANHSHFF